MTTYKALEYLKDTLIKIAENMRLQTKDNESKKPDIVLGYLEPLKVDEEEKDTFPYIIIRYLEGEEELNENEINVKLIFGVYSQDIKGWVDILHMVEVVKRGLLTREVFDYFSINYPLKTMIPEEQPYPYFYGFLDLKLVIPKVQLEGEVEHWQV